VKIQRDGDRVAIVLKAGHLTAAVVAAGAIAGAGLFLGLRAVGLIPTHTPALPDPDPATWLEAPRYEVDLGDRPSVGPPDAPVTIVEFTDYGCPYCRRHATEVLPRLLEEYGDTIRYVVRHFPIPALTPHALAAADAAECAYRQDRFWEYKDALLRQAAELSDQLLRATALSVGLDTARFGRCLEEGGTRSIVERDILTGWKLGVMGTPSFFINGRRFRGVRRLEELEMYVDLALEEEH
jgi:protein-disulfide isomerase